MSKATFVEQAVDPATPAAGRVTFFAKAKDFYQIDDLGAVTKLSSSASKSHLMFGDFSLATSTTTRYLFPGVFDGSNAHTTELQIEVAFPGTVRNMRIVHTAVGVGAATITYTARKNAANQTLAVAIGATSAGGNDTSNSFAVVAGDKVSVSAAKSASITTSPQHIFCTMEIEAD